MSEIQNTENEQELRPYLSSAGAWAIALGTSIGWGSVVVTSTSYLASAGPLGSVLGIMLAAAFMLVISNNYHYMMLRYPDAGGVYSYAKEVFGYDHGFLTAWFLSLAYMAVCWANATSFPLFARYFIGNVFQFGFHYSIFGYEIYLGEALLSIAAILLTSIICTLRPKITEGITITLAVIFSIGIVVCFTAAILKHGGSPYSFSPAFIPDKNIVLQITRTASISPWAYIGFENISNSTAEFKFKKTKSFRVLAIAMISSTILYVMLVLLSATCYPSEYATWLDYVRDLGNLSGIKGIPAFYAADYYLGGFGVRLLMISLLALIVTSMTGMLIAVGRLLYAMSRDEVISKHMSVLNKHRVPARAIWFLAAISIIIPFLGRTAIGWIVDVTTFTATFIYGYVSAATLKFAREMNDKKETYTGAIGLIAMVLTGIMLLLPNLFSTESMTDESYLIITVWAVLGFLYFRHILKKDATKRFGNSIIVWLALLSLILFTSLVWLNQSSLHAAKETVNTVKTFYADGRDGDPVAEAQLMEDALGRLQSSNSARMTVVVFMFAVAIGMLINNYRLMSRRQKESEAALGSMKNTAYRDAMTGVKNKNAYAEKEIEMTEQIKLGLIDEFAVVVCDVNGLKYVNDTYGHKAGDAYICASCKMVCETFKHSPVYRIGGDEFIAIMTGGDFAIRDKLMNDINSEVEGNIGTTKPVVAVGMALFDKENDNTFHSVFERADTAMYARKQTLKAMGATSRDERSALSNAPT